MHIEWISYIIPYVFYIIYDAEFRMGDVENA